MILTAFKEVTPSLEQFVQIIHIGATPAEAYPISEFRSTDTKDCRFYIASTLL